MRRRRIGMTAVVALAALVGCGSSGVTYRVPSPSMSPTYKVGQVVNVDTGAYEHDAPQRGDVVVFYPPKGAEDTVCGIAAQPTNGHPCALGTPGKSRSKYIKRIVGLPGEWLYVMRHHVFTASSRGGPYAEQREPFIRVSGCSLVCNLRRPIEIPAGSYYMLGDNRDTSADSRLWGPVPRAYFVGRVSRLH
jgi:signal peptidase I